MQQPDKEILTQWYSGDLEGPQLERVEQWADENPELASSMVEQMMEPIAGLDAIDGPVDVPYPEFFNSKLEQRIFTEQEQIPEAAKEAIVSKPAGLMQRFGWMFAPAVLAAMVVCFYVGTQFGSKIIQSQTVNSENVEKHIIYVTNEAVMVEVIDSEEASVIEVNGLEPFSDEDITVSYYETPESNQDAQLILAPNTTHTWF